MQEAPKAADFARDLAVLVIEEGHQNPANARRVRFSYAGFFGRAVRSVCMTVDRGRNIDFGARRSSSVLGSSQRQDLP